jgi:hypothetical protein
MRLVEARTVALRRKRSRTKRRLVRRDQIRSKARSTFASFRKGRSPAQPHQRTRSSSTPQQPHLSSHTGHAISRPKKPRRRRSEWTATHSATSRLNLPCRRGPERVAFSTLFCVQLARPVLSPWLPLASMCVRLCPLARLTLPGAALVRSRPRRLLRHIPSVNHPRPRPPALKTRGHQSGIQGEGAIDQPGQGRVRPE